MAGKLPWKVNLILADSAREWINSGKGIRYGNFDPTAAVWAGLEGHNDVDEYIFAWYSSQSTSDIGSLKDDQLDSMLLKGRSIERKREFAETVTREAARILKCSTDAVDVVFADVEPHDWAVSGKRSQGR